MSARRLFSRDPGALLLGVIALLVAAFSYLCHEPWRDEAGAMLEASAVPWSGLLAAMRLEGIPPLYHVLLKALGSVLPGHEALVLAGLLGFSTLLFGTRRLAEAVGASPRAALGLTAALACTYVYAYELGVMMRQYTLGLGLSLLCLAHLRIALVRGSRRSLRIGAATGGLAALTSAHSACLAGGALLAFGLLWLARRRRLARIWPVLLTLPCFALVVYDALPHPGRTPEANRALHHTLRVASRLAAQAVVAGVMPFDWWHASSFLPRALASLLAALRGLALWSLLAGAALALVLRVRGALLRRRLSTDLFELVAVLLSWPPLLLIIVEHYWGFHRHHLFLGLPLVLVVAAWSLSRPGARPLSAPRALLFALVPWFLLQASLAFGDLLLDYHHPFSDTRAAAAALPPSAHVVAVDEWRTAAMLFWRPDLRLRAQSGRGRVFHYSRPDTDWHRAAPLPPIVAEECHLAPSLVFLAGPSDVLGPHADCATLIDYPRTPFADHPFTWETFPLHRIDCACLAAPRRTNFGSPD